MLVAFNKPYGVLSQYTDKAEPPRPTLAGFGLPGRVFPAGRLDADSEGLLMLSDSHAEVARLTAPGGAGKTYLVQVEGVATDEALSKLRAGVTLKDGRTRPAQATALAEPPAWLWPRTPPVRFRKTVPDCFITLTIFEGKNRQVRRMTAAVGLPCLRLVRLSVGSHQLADLAPGQWREV